MYIRSSRLTSVQTVARDNHPWGTPASRQPALLQPTRLWPALSLAFLVLLFHMPVFAQTTNCVDLFQQGKLLAAASCFLRKANAMPPLNKLSLTQRYTKGRYLKNAASALRAAAQKSNQPEYQAYLYEHALAILEQYVNEQLHENQRRLLSVLQQKAALNNNIRFARLTLRTNHPRAKICLKGYKFNRCHTGTLWRLRLRPGVYTFELQTPDGQEIKRQFDLPPSSQKKFNFARTTTMVNIQTSPPGSQIFVDGSLKGRSPTRIALQPGAHTFRIKRPCYQPHTRTLQLRVNQTRNLRIQLTKAPMLHPHASQRLLGWTGIAVGAGFAVLGIVAQGVAASHFENSLKYANAPQGLTPQAYEQLFKDSQEAAGQANTWQTVALLGMGIGATGVVLGVVRLITIPPAPPDPCRQP